ncbi:translocation/assembly module TamB domain-containing protein [Methylophilus sp. 14]|uniref:translocation/assembly module TamB domain-containing protein n=1 Tax=Methylophilus sp. 14 TaxID=2781019 RepID=UPI00188E5541|nr:translocation/assembly module TamB domain-containing protein [Methylophilus sp. 14]MBF4989429.1 translocation/assembly module TamB domain-containing protein [Methylophilus sp. 14]
MSLVNTFKRLLKLILNGVLCLSLIITPQMVWAANVLLMTSLKEFETDLGNATLKVDGIDSNMHLAVTPKGELTVSQFRAKQITLRFKPTTEVTPTPQTTKTPLPSHINIPLPFHLLSGQIDRLTIIQGTSTSEITQIQFDLDADNQALQFRIAQALSPWGKVSTHFQMQNAAPFALNGWLDVQQPQTELPYHLRTELHGDLTRLEIAANHHYQPQARPFAIVPASGQTEDLLQISASIGLDETRNSHLLLHLQQLQAKHIHPQLAGKVDLKIVTDGSLTEQGQMLATIDAGDSRLQGQPLIVRGSASLQGTQLMHMDLLAQLDKNKLTIQAGKNTSTAVVTTLSWQAELENLAQLMPGFAGQVKGTGTVQQSASGFATTYQLSGQKLQLPQGLTLVGFEAQGQATDQTQGSLKNQVKLRSLSQQNARGIDSPPIDAELNLTGTLAKHQLALKVQDADPLLQRNLLLALEGSWQANTWQAQLTQLQDANGKVFQLAQPASLQWQNEQGFQLQNLVVNALSGQLQLDQLRYRPARTANPVTQQPAEKVQFSTQGALKAFPLQALMAWLVPEHSEALPADHLRVSAQWKLALDEQLNGTLHLERASGDWQTYNNSEARWQGLGINTLFTEVQAQNNRISVQSSIRADSAIDLQFTGNTVVTPTANGMVIQRSAPLSAQLKANISQLGWLAKLMPDMQPAGQLTIDAQASGIIAQPKLQGSLQGQALALQVPSQGLWLEQGNLHATLAGDQVNIDQLHFAGKTGELNGNGQLVFKEDRWQLDAAMQLNKLQALSRVDRWVQLSGNTNISMTSEQTTLSGKLKIHKGLFELPKADKPKLDEDVVIESPQTSQAEPTSKLVFNNFALDFGDKPLVLPFKESEQFMLRGQGLNGALSGNMQLNGALDELTAAGTLEITGTYIAYGQSLNIETGRLIFSGKLPNIGLDMLATRQVESTKVGIQINGSLQTPQLKLVSTPDTSNENKISLLVLGQPMSQVGSSDMALLSVAAGALLSQGDSVSLQTKIAQAVGLDSIDVRGSGPTNYAVSVGKRINRNLVVGYEKSIVGLLNVGKLTYQLTKRISIETRTGSDNALDVFYGFSFD